MGMSYTTTVGFGYELYSRKNRDQMQLVQEYFAIDSELDEYDIDEIFQEKYPELCLRLTGDYWSGEVQWNVFAKSTAKELESRGKQAQEDCTEAERVALTAFAKEYKKIITEAKPEWLALQSIV